MGNSYCALQTGLDGIEDGEESHFFPISMTACMPSTSAGHAPGDPS